MTNNNTHARDAESEIAMQHCPYCGRGSKTPDQFSGEDGVGVITCPEHGGIGVVRNV